MRVYSNAFIILYVCASIFIFRGYAEKQAAKIPEHPPSIELFGKYCIDCHDADNSKGDLDLDKVLEDKGYDKDLIFENLITSKMPPKDKKQPSKHEKQVMLNWLTEQQNKLKVPSKQRLGRHEFIQTSNDLLGTNLDYSKKIKNDQGTYRFDSNRKILLTRDLMSSYFSVTDEMLDMAYPKKKSKVATWSSNTLMPTVKEYSQYTKKYKEGILFSWTRAKNGTPYAFFYKGFKAPEDGYYDVNIEAAKVANFKDHISLIISGGKYFKTTALTHPQQILKVVSLYNKKLKNYQYRVFLKKGDSISVHCYSPHTWRLVDVKEGVYIKRMKAKGPFLNKNTLKITGSSKDELKQTLKTFAEKAFSSSLSEKELSPYYKVSLDHFEAKHNYAEAVKVGFKAILCSHRILLIPGQHANESYKKASFLSRVLWLSVPDDELLNIATKNKLNGKELEVQIDRMIKDEKSLRFVQSFCNQWLNLKSLDEVTPSLKLYPKFNPLLNHYLPIETELYVRHLIQNDLSVTHLIDADFSFLNQRLADHYGVPGVIGQKFRKVKFGKEVKRGGLMTMASVLKVTADGFHTSPILRGTWISKNIAGTTLSPPPENIEVIEPDLSKAETLREQIEMHKNNKSCYACHKSIDPYGFALENYDPTGAWREKYRLARDTGEKTFAYRREGHYDIGKSVDASGSIDKVKFNDIDGLKKILISDHKKIAYNFLKNIFEYANGYKPSLAQRMDIYKMIPEHAKKCGLKKLIRVILIYSLNQEH